MTTSTSGRREEWSALLPAVRMFDALVPLDVVACLERCLRAAADDRRGIDDGLMAAALIRCWWGSLEDQGHRLDPYPGLTGTAYLWSALRLVAHAGEADRVVSDGAWNVLRRAEANVKAWWLEQVSQDTVVVLYEMERTGSYVQLNFPSTTTTAGGDPVVRPRNRRSDALGWEWLNGTE